MPERPVHRAYLAYCYVIAFIAVLVLLFAGTQALFGIVRIAVPGQTAADGGYVPPPPPIPLDTAVEGDARREDPAASHERRRGVADLLEGALAGGLALLVLRQHWRRATTLREAFEGGPPPPQPEDVGQPEPPA